MVSSESPEPGALLGRDAEIAALLESGDSAFASKVTWLGTLSYCEARKIQEEAVAALQTGEAGERIFLCEHHPTLTLGPRTKPEHLFLNKEQWTARGVELLEVNRGGGASFHGYGQLMLYPVLSLRSRRFGVKDFVFQGLELLAATARDLGIECEARLEPPGIWIAKSDINSCGKKLLSVGLRIERGVSNHGYCLNVSPDLSNFSHFTPCGQSSVEMTSLAKERSLAAIEFSDVIASFLKNSGDFWRLGEQA